MFIYIFFQYFGKFPSPPPQAFAKTEAIANDAVGLRSPRAVSAWQDRSRRLGMRKGAKEEWTDGLSSLPRGKSSGGNARRGLEGKR